VVVPIHELPHQHLAGVHGYTHRNWGGRLAAAKADIAQDKINSIIKPHAPYFGGRECAMIELADQLLLPNMYGGLTKSLHDGLSIYYSDGDIYELGSVGAVLTSMTKMLFVYDLVERAPSCPIVSLSDATK
jgi:hypothetical protein